MYNPLIGRTLTGIIVGGDDNDPDPQQMGRVKVLFPQVQNPDNFDFSTLQWVQLSSNPQHNGHYAFNRPADQGTVVSGEIINNAGHVLVRHVINGKYKPDDSDQGNLVQGPLNKARNTAPQKRDGAPAPTQQEKAAQSRPGGVERVQRKDSSPNHPPSSVAMRDSIPVNIGGLFQAAEKFLKVSSVSTALTQAQNAMNEQMSSALPGNLISSLGDITKLISPEVMNKLSGELQQTLSAIENLVGSFKPINGTNFIHTLEGAVADPSSLVKSIENAVTSAVLPIDAINALTNIINTTSLISNLPQQIMNDISEIFVNVIDGPSAITAFIAELETTPALTNLPSTLIAEIIAALGDTTDPESALAILENILGTTTAFGGIGGTSLPQVATAFGNASASINNFGNIVTTLSQELQQAQQTFQSFMSSIPNAASTFLNNSNIPTELIGRFPTQVQEELKKIMSGFGDANKQPARPNINKIAKAYLGDGESGTLLKDILSKITDVGV